MDGPDVAAVVVTHESAGILPACLDSLAEHAADVDLLVVVADSGSTDGVEAVCRGREAAFLGGSNRGFGAAANRALRHDAVRRARYVLVMNPDVEIREGSLAEFVTACDQRPAGGIFAPRQVDERGRLICSIGRQPSPAGYWRDWVMGRQVWIWDREVYEHEARCDWVLGSFMVIRQRLVETLGGFDERFFLYSEEVDLCTRARRAGWEVAYLPRLTVVHPDDRPPDEHRERMILWSKIVYIRKWHSRRARASMRLALVARHVRQLFRALRSRGSVRLEWVRLCAALRFRASRYGPAPTGRRASGTR